MVKLLQPFLQDAISTMRIENFEAFRKMSRCSAPFSASIQNSTEIFTMTFTQQEVLFNLPGATDLQVQLREHVVEDLMSNRTSLLRALRKNEIVAIGSIDALARLNEAFSTFVRGAIRCPSLPALLHNYQNQGTGGSRREKV